MTDFAEQDLNSILNIGEQPPMRARFGRGLRGGKSSISTSYGGSEVGSSPRRPAEGNPHRSVSAAMPLLPATAGSGLSPFAPSTTLRPANAKLTPEQRQQQALEVGEWQTFNTKSRQVMSGISHRVHAAAPPPQQPSGPNPYRLNSTTAESAIVASARLTAAAMTPRPPSTCTARQTEPLIAGGTKTVPDDAARIRSLLLQNGGGTTRECADGGVRAVTVRRFEDTSHSARLPPSSASSDTTLPSLQQQRDPRRPASGRLPRLTQQQQQTLDAMQRVINFEEARDAARERAALNGLRYDDNFDEERQHLKSRQLQSNLGALRQSSDSTDEDEAPLPSMHRTHHRPSPPLVIAGVSFGETFATPAAAGEHRPFPASSVTAFENNKRLREEALEVAAGRQHMLRPMASAATYLSSAHNKLLLSHTADVHTAASLSSVPIEVCAYIGAFCDARTLVKWAAASHRYRRMVVVGVVDSSASEISSSGSGEKTKTRVGAAAVPAAPLPPMSFPHQLWLGLYLAHGVTSLTPVEALPHHYAAVEQKRQSKGDKSKTRSRRRRKGSFDSAAEDNEDEEDNSNASQPQPLVIALRAVPAASLQQAVAAHLSRERRALAEDLASAGDHLRALEQRLMARQSDLREASRLPPTGTGRNMSHARLAAASNNSGVGSTAVVSSSNGSGNGNGGGSFTRDLAFRELLPSYQQQAAAEEAARWGADNGDEGGTTERERAMAAELAALRRQVAALTAGPMGGSRPAAAITIPSSEAPSRSPLPSTSTQSDTATVSNDGTVLLAPWPPTASACESAAMSSRGGAFSRGLAALRGSGGTVLQRPPRGGNASSTGTTTAVPAPDLATTRAQLRALVEAQSTNAAVDIAQETNHHIRQRQHSVSQEARVDFSAAPSSPLAGKHCGARGFCARPFPRH